MPRRMPHDHAEMRARAVASARAAVAEGGIPALTARRVAGELGCSVGSLYNLFVDLDDLVLHVSASVVDDMQAALFGPPLPADPTEGLIEIALRYVAFAEREGRIWALVFEHEPGHDRPTPAWQVARIERLVASVAAVAAPLLGGSDAAAARADVEVLWASVHGIAALAQKNKLGFVTATPPADLARRLVATFLAGRRSRA